MSKARVDDDEWEDDMEEELPVSPADLRAMEKRDIRPLERDWSRIQIQSRLTEKHGSLLNRPNEENTTKRAR